MTAGAVTTRRSGSTSPAISEFSQRVDYRPAAVLGDMDMQSIVAGPWQFVRTDHRAWEELFDFGSDPRNERNMIGRPELRGTVETLRARLIGTLAADAPRASDTPAVGGR